MSLTPKEAGGSRVVFPVPIEHSCLVESVAASPDCPENVTVSMGFKPAALTTPPLNDVTGHYALTIKKEGAAVSVYKGMALVRSLTLDTTGQDLFYLVDSVLTAVSGSSAGYWSNLWAVGNVVGPERFWNLSRGVTGLVIPAQPDTDDLDVLCHLDFVDATLIGEDAWNFKDADLYSEVVTTATASASSYYSTCYASNLQDKNTSTYWMVASPTTSWIEFTFASPTVIEKYGMTSWSTDKLDRLPSVWTFEGSNDGETWEVLDAHSGESWPTSYTQRDFTFENGTAYTSYRISIAANNGHVTYTMMSEVCLYTRRAVSPNMWDINGLQTLDTPTNNYCTWNAMQQSYYPTHADYMYSDGNTVVTGTDSDLAFGTMWVKTGKWYWEFDIVNYTASHFYVGVGGNITYNAYDGNSRIHQNFGGDNASTAYGDPYTTGDVVGVALDLDNLTCEFFKNGASQGVLDFTECPSAGGSPYVVLAANNGGSVRLQTGATGFEHAPPEGFLPLCASNLPDPLVLESSKVADVILRDGTWSATDVLSGGTVTFSAQLSGFQAVEAFNGTTVYADSWNTGTKQLDHWIQYDLGEGNEKTLRGYQLANVPSYETYWAVEATLTASNDGLAWTQLDYWSDDSKPSSFSRFFENETLYRYYKWTFNNDNPAGRNLIVGYIAGIADATPVKLDFAPDFVNIKARDNSSWWWQAYDSVRGVETFLSTDTSDVEKAEYPDGLLSFDADGYTLGALSGVNASGYSFLDLCLKAGPDQGFEIVSYIGDGIAGKEITHSLGKAPSFIIVKCLTYGGYDWQVYHAGLGATKTLSLNTTGPAKTDSTAWNDTEPTATHFTVGDMASINADGESFIAYLFADSDIFRTFSYTGLASTDGPYIYLGGKPLSVPFWKNTETVSTTDYDWYVFDQARDPSNPVKHWLRPNLASAEGVGSSPYPCQFTSSGIKVTGSNWNVINADGKLHVGLAILESVQKYSNAF